MDTSTQNGREINPDQSVDHAAEVPTEELTTVAAAGPPQDIAVASLGAKQEEEKTGNAQEEVEPDETEECEPSVGSAVASTSGVANETEVVEQQSTQETSSGPQDIAAASVGKSPDPGVTVIPPDDRVRIHSTDKYPWCTHASLLIIAKDNTPYIGTAWFVGPDTLMTAGHCVFINGDDEDKNGWVKSIKVMPGRNEDTLPFGHAYATRLYSVKGWTKGRKVDYDYGAIKISKDMGTGWLGSKAYKASALEGRKLNSAGYPGDKPAGTLWYHFANVTRVTDRLVFHDTDTYGGQSGSAIYRIEPGEKRYCFAIHTNGTLAVPPKENFGTRINNEVVKNIKAWKKA